MVDPPSRKRPSQYKSFDPLAKRLRDAALKSLAKSYFDHTRANGGKCKRGFVKGLVDQAGASAQGLKITRDDINNEIKRMQKDNNSRISLVSPTEGPASDPTPASADSLNLNLLAFTASEVQRQPVDMEVESLEALPQPVEVAAAEVSAEVALDPSCNFGKGGRPKGTSLESQRAKALARKKAVNWVAVKFSEKRTELLESNTHGTRAKLEPGTLQKLVARAVARFKIEGEFDVPRQTIFSRIKAERLGV